MDDNKLMQEIRNGNKQAFELLMRRYRTPAIFFANKYVHDLDAAEDIVQESFADIYIQRYEFDQQYRFSTYFYTIVKHRSLNYRKKHRELLLSSMDEDTEISIEEKHFVNPVTPESEYFKQVRYAGLLEALDSLKEEERMILYLYAVAQQSYKEIAEKMQKSVAQVKISIFRARKKIRKWEVDRDE